MQGLTAPRILFSQPLDFTSRHWKNDNSWASNMTFLLQFGHTLREYAEHYRTERNHQGLANELIKPSDNVGAVAGNIARRQRLSNMLRYYHRRDS